MRHDWSSIHLGPIVNQTEIKLFTEVMYLHDDMLVELRKIQENAWIVPSFTREVSISLLSTIWNDDKTSNTLFREKCLYTLPVMFTRVRLFIEAIIHRIEMETHFVYWSQVTWHEEALDAIELTMATRIRSCSSNTMFNWNDCCEIV